MNLENYKTKLEGKTFIFKIGSYKNFGGAETQSLILARVLKKEFNAKIIFIADGGTGIVKDTYNKEGFETLNFAYRLKGTKTQKLIDTVKFIWFLRKLKPDFILPYSSDNCKKILGNWKYTGAKYAWWNMQDEGRFLFKTKHEEKLIKSVTEIVSNSYVGSEFLQTHYNLGARQIQQYNNPIAVPDTALIKPLWRNQLKLEANAIVVSMIANLTLWKDHKTLFNAWKYVLDHFQAKQQPIYLVLAGDTRETTKDLKVLAFDLQIGHSIKMLGSIQKTNELIMESDMVVHSSLKEGVPNAICEAMALEKPVVATNISGNREGLSDRYLKTTLTEPNNPIDLAQKIIELLENKALAKEIGIYNKQRILQEYTQDQMVKIFLDSFVKYA